MTTTHSNGAGHDPRPAHRSTGTWVAAITTTLLGVMAAATLLMPGGSTGARCPTVSAQLAATGSDAARSIGCDGAVDPATAGDASVLVAATDPTSRSSTPTGTTTHADLP